MLRPDPDSIRRPAADLSASDKQGLQAEPVVALGSFQTTAGNVTLAGDVTGTAGSNTVVATHLTTPLPAAQGGLGGTTLAGDASGGPQATTVTATHLASGLPQAQGGTGSTSPAYTQHALVAQDAGFFKTLATGTSGNPLVSQGSAADPTFTTLGVAGGGTGDTTLAAHGVLVGNGTGAVSVTGTGTAGQVLTSNGAAADPTFQAAGGGAYKLLAKSTATTNQTITSSTFVDVTGLSVTFTPDGTHDAKITVSLPNWLNAGSGGTVSYWQLLKDGSVIDQWDSLTVGATGDFPPMCVVYVDAAPSAVSHTYKLQAASNSVPNALQTIGSRSTPSQNLILAEQIG